MDLGRDRHGLLVLEDGRIFRGYRFGADSKALGEVVFNTSMTGYQEILTDPSYCQQIVTLTYPHIGNYGVNEEDAESTKVHAAGLVINSMFSVIVSPERIGTAGAFASELEAVLEREGIIQGEWSVLVTGVSAAVCAHACALGFANRHYYTIIPMDATAAATVADEARIYAQYSSGAYNYCLGFTPSALVEFVAGVGELKPLKELVAVG